MWLIASRWVSCTTCVYTSIVMLIWLCPRISMMTRGATPAAVSSVAFAASSDPRQPLPHSFCVPRSYVGRLITR